MKTNIGTDLSAVDELNRYIKKKHVPHHVLHCLATDAAQRCIEFHQFRIGKEYDPMLFAGIDMKRKWIFGDTDLDTMESYRRDIVTYMDRLYMRTSFNMACFYSMYKNPYMAAEKSLKYSRDSMSNLIYNKKIQRNTSEEETIWQIRRLEWLLGVSKVTSRMWLIYEPNCPFVTPQNVRINWKFYEFLDRFNWSI